MESSEQGMLAQVARVPTKLASRLFSSAGNRIR